MLTPLNTAEFQTSRLNVFRIDIKSSDESQSRAIFLAFYSDEEIPWPVVSATVWIDGPYVGHTMEMIQTHDDHRQAGLAKELWLGIEEYLGRAVITGKSDEAGLAHSVAQAREQIGRAIPDLNDPAVQEQIKQARLRQQDKRTELP